MPRQLWVDDEIEFRDKTHMENVKGPFQEAKVHFVDDFTDDTLSTDKWAVAVTNATCAVNHSTYAGGHALYTSDTTDNETGFLASALCWEDDLNVIAEFRVRITDVSGVAVFVGLSDARSETSPDMPIDYADGTLAAASGVNAVGFIVDADDSVNGASSIVGVSAKAGAVQTAADSGTDWEDTIVHNLRIKLDSDANAVFYLDGNSCGRIASSITSGSKLCLIVAVANRDAAADTVYIDKIEAWQDREV